MARDFRPKAARQAAAATAKLREEEERAAQAKAAAATATQQQKKKTGPQKLGGPLAGKTIGVSNPGLDGMSPEMRARIERERRARAAEARLRGATGSNT